MLDILASHPRRMEVMREELAKAREAIATPRMTDIIEAVGRPARREPDRAGPDGGDHHARRLHQAHAAGDVPRTEPWRPRAHRRGDARRRHRHPQLPRAYASMGAVLLARAEKCSARRCGGCRKPGRTRRAGRWSTCCPNLAAIPSPPCCRCRRTRRCGIRCIWCSARRSGNVRRNRLSDFRNVRSTGLIAMKLDEGDHLIGVATCREGDDVLLATRKRPLHPLPAFRRHRARVRRPRFHRRARHQAAGQGRGDQPVRAAPRRCDDRGTRGLSAHRQCEASRQWQRQWR